MSVLDVWGLDEGSEALYRALLRNPGQLAAGRVMRGFYPRDVVDDPRRLAYARRWAAAAEEVRWSAL